jgi:hypothetical protein
MGYLLGDGDVFRAGWGFLEVRSGRGWRLLLPGSRREWGLYLVISRGSPGVLWCNPGAGASRAFSFPEPRAKRVVGA